MTEQNAQPSPVQFFRAVNAYQQTESLKAAIELDLFTAISEGQTTIEKIAERCKASERGVRILCDFLVVSGFLAKDGSHYSLTLDTSVFLNRNSPAYIGGSIEFLLSPMLLDGYKDLAAAVRKGGTTQKLGTIEPEHPIWIRFAKAMAPLAMLSAQAICEYTGDSLGNAPKILDVAASHGLYGITLARTHPNGEVFAVDWPNVLEVAKENAEKFGVTERYHLIAGSAFDVAFGKDYDLVLLTNFLHHFDPPTCEKFLGKVNASLKTGGRCITLEFVPNEDRVTPPESATFSLTMLASTPAGDAYTFSEFERMFQAAGFTRNQLHPLKPTFEHIIVSYK